MPDLRLTPSRDQFPRLLEAVENGSLKLPAFQREFVWPIEKTIDLLDSIARRYPVGNFLFWQTTEALYSVKEIGGLELPETPVGQATEALYSVKEIGGLELPETPVGQATRYILDGQQRITSLYAAAHSAEIEGRAYQICVDLDQSHDEPGEIFQDIAPDRDRYVLVSDLLGEGHIEISQALTPDRRQRLYALRERIREYPIAFTLIEDGTLDAVCEIFERVNNTGVPLSVFDLLVAKTWSPANGDDPDEGFDLRSSYLELKEQLEAVEYDDIGEAEVTRLAGALINSDCSRRAILEIQRDQMRDQWTNVREGITAAVDFIRSSLGVPTSRLLPYPALVVPIAYFYVKSEFRTPSAEQVKWFRRYFFLSGLAGRFQYAVPGTLSDDIRNLITKLVDGDLPEIPCDPPDLRPETIAQTQMSVGRAYCKSILCLLAAERPLDFRNAAEIHLQRKFLQQSNSRQYHHIFPKAYLRRELGHEGNVVANIAFVSADLNKRIAARAPSDYLVDYQMDNVAVWNRVLDGHAISQSGWEAVRGDEYQRFIAERSETLSSLAERAVTAE